jgi:hypothetical protein
MKTKTCTKCGGVFPATVKFFYRKRANKFNGRCKSCYRAKVIAYQQSPHGKALIKQRRKKPEFALRAREVHRVWRSKPDVLAKIRARARRLAQKPEQKIKALLYQRRYLRERFKADPLYKVKWLTHQALRHALRGRISKGSKWWKDLLGYTADELRQHIEVRFSGDMAWSNYGRVWEIDHIRPLASFYIPDTRCDAFREAWALSNLRPLLKHLNRRKGARIEPTEEG